MLNLISSDDLRLLQNFKRVKLSSILLFNKTYFSIGSFTNDGNHFEILFSDITTFLILFLDN
jgi:hypothetical protein